MDAKALFIDWIIRYEYPALFLLLMLGFGLRLDTGWQVLAWTLLAAGAVGAGVGLLGLARDRPARALPSALGPGDNAAGGTDCVPRSA